MPAKAGTTKSWGTSYAPNVAIFIKPSLLFSLTCHSRGSGNLKGSCQWH